MGRAASTTSCATGSSAASISGRRSRSSSWTPTANRRSGSGRFARKIADRPAGKMTFDATHDSPQPPLKRPRRTGSTSSHDGKRYKRKRTRCRMGRFLLVLLAVPRSEEPRAPGRSGVERPDPVDLYVGEAEHAVLHLLYARFWHKVLYDRGYVSTVEPLPETGQPGHDPWRDGVYRLQEGRRPVGQRGRRQETEEGAVTKSTGEPVTPQKLSPDQAEKQGEGFVLKADRSIRLRAGPTNVKTAATWSIRTKWSGTGGRLTAALRNVHGAGGSGQAVEHGRRQRRAGFLDRVWRMIVDDRLLQLARASRRRADRRANRMLHKTIKAVTQDIESMSFNTAIGGCGVCQFLHQSRDASPLRWSRSFCSCRRLHRLAEELWQLLGLSKRSLTR